ncbi:DUF6796 family protein [Aureibacter tunicatorum]|uniref:Uncharacterized protein n=1 Tax=Aureibacter tunicatorum TaxID=866807 RepID=A0AAE3XQE4_9BACT|nr:DUF6796 family protein [Aureibacter tunicatorum]MDR6240813.1 hypothetical protein [Aureibacter tunicatorum]BDD06854.1 hypothetical protein AUTU_43370 [Aureibacter tunicatorum]
MTVTYKKARLSGILGIIGSSMLFYGDYLFHYVPGSTDMLYNLTQISDFKIYINAFIAVVATWLYLASVFHIYYSFSPSSPVIRNLITALFSTVFLMYGIEHAAYLSLAISAKISALHNLPLEETTAFAWKIFTGIESMGSFIALFLTLLFLIQVLRKQTLYPRWMIVFFPSILLIFKPSLSGFLTGDVWTVIIGGYYNLIMIVFFTVSTLTLWKVKEPVASFQ